MLTLIRTSRTLIVVIIVVIVLITFFVVFLQPSNKNITYTVKRENLINTVLINGTYTTASQTPVNSPTNGIVTKSYVENDSIVKKGDPLFYVESTATDDQQKAAYTDYTTALSSLQTVQNNVQSLDAAMWAKQQAYFSAQNAHNFMINHATNPTTNDGYTDLEKLAINNAVTQTQKDFQAAEQTYKTANVSITAAQAKVSQTKNAYDETKSATVNAPATGKVINLSAKPGDQVSVASTIQSQGGQASITVLPVLVIADFSNPVLTSPVDQENRPQLKIGQKATIVFDALPDQTFSGQITSIDTAGTKIRGTVTFNVNVVVDNVTSAILPNMTASITIESARRDNVLTVPNDAIIQKDGRTFVQLANNNQQEVGVGLKGLTKTEVVNGLTSGDNVVEQQ